MDAPSTDGKVFEGKIFILGNYFSYKALNDGDSPALMNTATPKVFQDAGIPRKLIKGMALVFAGLLFKKRAGDAFLVAIIKVLVDVIPLELFNYLALLLGLFGLLKQFASVRQKLDIVDQVDWILNVLCHLRDACGNQQIRLLIDDNRAKQKIKFNYMRECNFFYSALVLFLHNLIDLIGPAVDLEVVVGGTADLLFGSTAQDGAKMTTGGQALHLNGLIAT
jgi:hypothetical protein